MGAGDNRRNHDGAKRRDRLDRVAEDRRPSRPDRDSRRFSLVPEQDGVGGDRRGRAHGVHVQERGCGDPLAGRGEQGRSRARPGGGHGGRWGSSAPVASAERGRRTAARPMPGPVGPRLRRERCAGSSHERRSRSAAEPNPRQRVVHVLPGEGDADRPAAPRRPRGAAPGEARIATRRRGRRRARRAAPAPARAGRRSGRASPPRASRRWRGRARPRAGACRLDVNPRS